MENVREHLHEKFFCLGGRHRGLRDICRLFFGHPSPVKIHRRTMENHWKTQKTVSFLIFFVVILCVGPRVVQTTVFCCVFFLLLLAFPIPNRPMWALVPPCLSYRLDLIWAIREVHRPLLRRSDQQPTRQSEEMHAAATMRLRWPNLPGASV